MALVARRENFLDGNLAVLAAKRSYILYGFSDLGLSLLGIRHKLSNRPACSTSSSNCRKSVLASDS
jgi:hypothetical protein